MENTAFELGPHIIIEMKYPRINPFLFKYKRKCKDKSKENLLFIVGGNKMKKKNNPKEFVEANAYCEILSLNSIENAILKK